MDGSENERITSGEGSVDPPPRLRLPSVPVLRDLVSLGLATLILVHETLAAGSSDPALITAACALLGLPLVARAEGRGK